MRMFYLRTALVVLVALCPILSLAETTFLPVLVTGKTWDVATFNKYDWFDGSLDATGHYCVSVAGDTIVNGLDCKKIEIVRTDGQGESMTAIAREENGKVWSVKKDGTQFLLFDIGLKKYDSVDAGFVVEEDVICVNGIKRKRLTIDSGVDVADGEYFYYVVEGIGISKDEWLINGGLGIAKDGEYCRLMSCSENGEVVFTISDFTTNRAFDIGDVNAAINMMLGKAEVTTIYDMNHDGLIDIAEVNAVINAMLGK